MSLYNPATRKRWELELHPRWFEDVKDNYEVKFEGYWVFWVGELEAEFFRADFRAKDSNRCFADLLHEKGFYGSSDMMSALSTLGDCFELEFSINRLEELINRVTPIRQQLAI